MQSRSSIVNSSEAILKNAQQLESEKNKIKEEIAKYKEMSESQHEEAKLIAALMKRSSPPSLEETKPRIELLKKQISEAKSSQVSLTKQTQQLQAQIDRTISYQLKKSAFQRDQSELQSVKDEYSKQLSKEEDLRLRSSQLSSDLMKAQLARKALENKISDETEAPVTLEPLQKKKLSISEQIQLIKRKKESFQQELTEAKKHLNEMQSQKEKLMETERKAGAIDYPQMVKRIVESASCNLELHRYKPESDGTTDAIKDLSKISSECDDLLLRANAEISS